MSELNNIPKHWQVKKLGEVCQVLDNLRKPINSAERQQRIAGKRQSELFPYFGATGQVGWIDDYMTDGKYILIGEDGAPFFKLIAEKSSPQLSELIVPLNHESINLFAEHLLREIGRARNGSTDLQVSTEALKEFWAEKKIFTGGFYPTDGSGLSRSNGVCTRTLAEVLRYMYLGPNREVFFNSLPVAGQSGTLQFAFKGTTLENNLQAKTGSMTRVRSLAGIFTNKAGRKVIFAMITNNFEGSQTTIGYTFEAFLNELFDTGTPPTNSGKSKK